MSITSVHHLVNTPHAWLYISLWRQICGSLYNAYGLMVYPRTTKVNKVNQIAIQIWKGLRALKEVEAVRGDHANRLAILLPMRYGL